jgi:hypothetical protein
VNSRMDTAFVVTLAAAFGVLLVLWYSPWDARTISAVLGAIATGLLSWRLVSTWVDTTFTSWACFSSQPWPCRPWASGNSSPGAGSATRTSPGP